MSSTALQTFRPKTFRQTMDFLPLALLLLPAASQAQTQPVDPSAGLPTITASFNHTSLVNLAGIAYNFNYYDFNITGFQNVGAGNPAYDIFSFSNSTLEKQIGVVAVTSAYLPQGWTFDDTHDFTISTSPLSAIHADDPQFGLIFIQSQNAALLSPLGAPFQVFHQAAGVDPFVTPSGTPITVPVSAPVPEVSTPVSFGLLLLLGLGGVTAARRRRSARKRPLRLL